MSRDRKPPEESSAKVPAYIVTFSDMVTLLLTFFVMLLTLAQVRDIDLFNTTREAFVKRINTFGLGTLEGKSMDPEFADNKIKHFIENPDESGVGRTINAKEEDIRQIYKKIAETMTTMPSQIVAKKTDFLVTDISFSSGQAELNESARFFLKQFAANLQQQAIYGKIKLYVLGLAGDKQIPEKQWILSARRAQEAADFLKDILPAQFDCPVYSWGAGPGGNWVSRDSGVSDKSQILIAILREND